MAAKSPDTPLRKRRRLRRRFILLLLPVLVFAGGWRAAERYIDIEHYRGVIDEELELLIELPLSFGAMDLRLFPTPRLVVQNVALGEDDFMAFSPEVTVTANLAKLTKKQLDLRVVNIEDVRVQLPAETAALRERWSNYMLALNTPDPPSGKPILKVTLESITAEGAQVFRGDTRYATGDLHVHGVTAGAPTFEFDVTRATADGTPSAKGEFVLTVDADPLLRGTADVRDLLLSNLTGDESLPPFVLDGALEYAQAQNDDLQFSAKGEVRLAGQAAALGPFELDARYENGDLLLDRVAIQAEPLELRGALQLFHDGRWSLAIEEAVLRNEGIDWLVARLPEIPLANCPDRLSQGILRNVRMGDESGGGYSFLRGEIEVEGLGLALGGGYLLPGLGGRVSIADDIIQVEGLASDSVRASGTVQLAYETDTVVLDLAAQLLLNPGLPLPGKLSDLYRAESGTIDLQALQATVRAGVLDLPTLHGQVAIHDAVLAAWDGETKTFNAAPGFGGAVLLDRGVVHMSDVNGAGAVLSGTITPDETLERWAFDAQLKSDLASPIWKPFYPSASVSIQTGTLECSKLTGTLATGGTVPADLEVSGRIAGLALAIQSGHVNDQVTFEPITLTASNERLDAKLAGKSGLAGPFAAEGHYRLASGDLNAALTLRPMDAGTLPPALREGLPGAVLAHLSPLPLDIRYAGAGGTLDFSSESPVLSGTISMALPDPHKAPVGLDLKADVPVAWLGTYFSPDSPVEGNARLTASVSPKTGSVDVRVDMTDAAFGWGMLRKTAGYPAVLALAGDWGKSGRALSRGRVDAGGEHVEFALDGSGIQSGRLDVDLAPLAPLLPEGAVLGGRVKGRFATSPPSAALYLDAVRVQAGPAVAAAGAAGTLELADDGWTLDQMSLSAGDSRAVLHASQAGGNWEGTFAATLLDLNQLTEACAAYAAWRALHYPAAAGSESGAGTTFTGRIRCSAEQVKWAEATLKNVRTDAAATAGGLRLADISFAHGKGAGAGTVTYTRGARPEPDTVDVALTLDGVDAVLVEGLFMEEARGLAGRLDGTASLSFPLRDGSPSVVHDMNGQIDFSAADGTLGKLGLASKLLTALRATDVLRLRIPHLRDRGLTYNTLTGHIDIASGVFRLQPYSMADSTYVLSADAVFDFPKDTADGNVEIQVLEGVTGVARKIPLLGDAANIVNKVFGIPIKIVGKATDPAFRVGKPG